MANLTNEQLSEPGHTYIGKSGKPRILVRRTTMLGAPDQKNGALFFWKSKPDGKERECFISTWLEWVKDRVEESRAE